MILSGRLKKVHCNAFFIRSSLFFVLLSISQLAFSWSSHVHRMVTGHVYGELSSEERRYFNRLARSIITPASLPVNKSLSDQELFSWMGSWADHHRDIPLKALFKKYGEDLPDALKHLGKHNTSRWHYHNYPFDPDNIDCDFANNGRLLNVMNVLDQALKVPLTLRQEAVLIALQMHFIQDAHQPLHTATKLLQAKKNRQCVHDRGGNSTCVFVFPNNARMLGRQCNQNLHLLWDKGFDVFSYHKGDMKKQKPQEKKANHKHGDTLIETDRSEQFNLSVMTFDPERWVQESNKHIEFVYSLDPQQGVTQAYRERAKQIVSHQVDLVYTRLGFYLKSHYAGVVSQSTK